jgi:hypothetical protein
MISTARAQRPASGVRGSDEPTSMVDRPPIPLGVGLLALAAGLVLNTLVGPALLDLVDYPISDTLRNETIGLELMSLVLVAPWAVTAGVLVLRGRPVGAVLAMAPAAYVAYMFVQYLAGIPALRYGPHHLLHLALFVLAGWILVAAWRSTSAAGLVLGDQQARRWAIALAAMAAFIVLRWLPGLIGAIGGADLPASFAGDPGMHWTIFLLDLGVVVPVSFATAYALRSGRAWAVPGLYALVGWFALVPPSVLAMAITKHVNDDPMASAGDTAMFAVATALFIVVTVILYRPLLRAPALNSRRSSETSPAG